MLSFRKEFEDICQEKFDNDSKIGLLCSIAPDGYPHIALITSLSVKDKGTLMWGQFSHGLSKTYLKDNPKTGFLVLSPEQYYWWTGKALYKEKAVTGDDFDYFNNKPLFRYNSYFGFASIHYETLIDVSAGEKLPFPQIALGFLRSGGLKKLAGSVPKTGNETLRELPPFGMKLASSLACLKFAAYVDADGFPRIYPVMQGRPADAGTMVFSPAPYGDMLRQIPAGARTAIFMANLNLESLLLQGRWYNTEKGGHLKGSAFAIDKVYNSMLPLNRYIL